MEEFKKIDLFGYKFNMNIRKQETYSTFISGLGSLSMIVIFILLFVFQIQIMNS
jgi:hypothetical protein